MKVEVKYAKPAATLTIGTNIIGQYSEALGVAVFTPFRAGPLSRSVVDQISKGLLDFAEAYNLEC